MSCRNPAGYGGVRAKKR